MAMPQIDDPSTDYGDVYTVCINYSSANHEKITSYHLPKVWLQDKRPFMALPRM
jgi:hypothetical protein